jgi:exonuclease III
VADKPANVFRVAYGNINGFSAVPHTNLKANELRYWFRHMEVDFFVGNEGKINWARMPHEGRLPELFRSENDLRAVAAFNSNESFALKQYGGTFQLTMGQLASRVAETGVDDRNLGRWAWTQFKGRNGHSTRIVSVYVPCRSDGEETVYKQHQRHLRTIGIMDCPRHVLLHDLK